MTESMTQTFDKLNQSLKKVIPSKGGDPVAEYLTGPISMNEESFVYLA
jgi:hypothetical protein